MSPPSPIDPPACADPAVPADLARQVLSEASGFLKRGDLPACRATLERALELLPANPTVLAFLGNVLLIMGQGGEARQRLEASLAIKPNQIPVLTRLATACMATGDVGAFQAALSQALRLNPDDLDGLRLAAGFYSSRGLHRHAVGACQRILRQVPGDAASWSMLGQSHRTLGEYLEAKTAYVRRLALPPNDPAAWDAFLELGDLLQWEIQGGQSKPGSADSPFVHFQREAAERTDRFRGARARLAWMEFRKLFHSLALGPIWAAIPATLEEWKSIRVPRNRYAPICEWLSGTEAALAFESSGSLSMPEAFELLDILHDRIRFELHREIGGGRAPGSQSSLHQGDALPEPFSRDAAVNDLCQELRRAPSAIRATLLDGSMADRRIEAGLRDADVLCVVDWPQVGGGTFWEAAQWLFQLHHSLFAINPCLPRGPLIVFASEIDAAAEADLPAAILRRGVWCKGGAAEVRYHDGILEAVAAVGTFREIFETRLLSPSHLRSAYDVLLWAASALRLPVLLAPGEWAANADPQNALSQVSAVRTALGHWMTDRLPAGGTIDRAMNPGLVREAHLLRLAPTPEEISALGLSDALMADVRQIWQYVRDQTLKAAFEPSG
jgi:tetratricopeptide (TPR) repeat protein